MASFCVDLDDVYVEIIAAIAVLVLTITFFCAICTRCKRRRLTTQTQRVVPPVGEELDWLEIEEEEEGKENVSAVLFIDAPDPDNPAAIAALVRHVLESKGNFHQCLHVVLTGRPVNLRTGKTPSDEISLEMIARQDNEESDPEHAQKVLEDSAARIENYLKQCDIDLSMVTIYDGGVAPCAPISDHVHVWDFLFDRKDLVTEQEEDCGDILSPEQYRTLVAEISDMTEDDREEKLISILRSYPLVPLSTLNEELEQDYVSEVVIFLGGPATALVQLFKGDLGEEIVHKVTGLFGMFGALEPGEGTLLANQFNVACDMDAANELIIGNLFPKADKYLVTSETAKTENLVVSAEDLQKTGVGSYFVDLQLLWEAEHKATPQALFDVLPVMAFLKQYRGCFKWSRKKAVLQVQKGETDVERVFLFTDTEDQQHPFVSEPTRGQTLSKAMFLEFLRKSWEST